MQLSCALNRLCSLGIDFCCLDHVYTLKAHHIIVTRVSLNRRIWLPTLTTIVIIQPTIVTVLCSERWVNWLTDVHRALIVICMHLALGPVVFVTTAISWITMCLVIITSRRSFGLNLPFSFKKVCSALSHAKKHWSLKTTFSRPSWFCSKPAISLHFSKYCLDLSMNCSGVSRFNPLVLNFFR